MSVHDPQAEFLLANASIEPIQVAARENSVAATLKMPSPGISNTSNCAPEFYSFAELAARWCVSRPALYNILRGYLVIDFAPAPGRRGHKIVSANVVRQIERERERVMR